LAAGVASLKAGYIDWMDRLIIIIIIIIIITRMWANAQPDGRPVEHRWRPLFNAAKFG